MTAFSVRAELDHRRGWFSIPIEIDDVFGLNFAVSVFRGSIMKLEVIESLSVYFQGVGSGRYLARRATLGGQPIEFQVASSARLRLPAIDGVLGMDFLGRFTDVNLNLPTSTLSLIEI